MTHLDRATATAALALAGRAPSVHNTQPWRWRIGPSTVHLFADVARALPATDPEHRDLRISCGAALHHLRVALLAAGLGSTVHRLPDPAHPAHLASVELWPAEPDDDDLALASAIERRRSDRRVFSTWPVPDPYLDELAAAAAAQGAALHALRGAGELWTVGRLVERAAVQQALTPDVAQETAAHTGRSRGAPSGIPAVNVPRPDPAVDTGDVVAVRRTAAGVQAQSPLGRGESDGTRLALLYTGADRPVDQLRAGEALSAVLLTATRAGLATDPISQPMEVAATRKELRASVLDERGEPQVLVRLGWAPVSAAPVPATGRRPVTETIDAFDAPWT